MAYVRTTWVDGTTPVDATNMNKIEVGIVTLDNNKSDITHNHDDRYAIIAHTHDDRYIQLGNSYTKAQVDGFVDALEADIADRALLNHNHNLAYAAIAHNHNDLYYLKTEVYNKIEVDGLLAPVGVELLRLENVKANQVDVFLKSETFSRDETYGRDVLFTQDEVNTQIADAIELASPASGETLVVDTKTLEIDVAESRFLLYRFYPGNSRNQEVTCVSSDSLILEITPMGLMTGIASGTATITITHTNISSVVQTEEIEVTVI